MRKTSMIIVIIFFSFCHAFAQIENRIVLSLEEDRMTDLYNYEIAHVIFEEVKGTKFEGKVRFNVPPQNPDYLYVYDNDEHNYFGRNCNCSAYLPNMIVCDADLFASLKSKHSDHMLRLTAKEFENFEDIEWLYAYSIGMLTSHTFYDYNMIKYIIGHELSHLQLGHESGMVGANESVKRESQADSLFISKIADEGKSTLWFAMNNLMSVMYPKESLESFYDSDSATIYYSANGDGHQNWLIRLLSMQLQLNGPNQELDGSGYFEFLNDKLKPNLNPSIENRRICSKDIHMETRAVNQDVFDLMVDSLDLEWTVFNLQRLHYYQSEYLMPFLNSAVNKYILAEEEIEKTPTEQLLLGEIYFTLGDQLLRDDKVSDAQESYQLSYDTGIKRSIYEILKIQYENMSEQKFIHSFESESLLDLGDVNFLVNLLLYQDLVRIERDDIRQLALLAFPDIVSVDYLKYVLNFQDYTSQQLTRIINKPLEDFVMDDTSYVLANSFIADLYKHKDLEKTIRILNLVLNYLEYKEGLANRRDFGQLLNFKGVILCEQEKISEAIESYEKALLVRMKLLSDHQLPISSDLFAVGQTLFNLGNYATNRADSISYYDKAWDYYEQLDASELKNSDAIEMIKLYYHALQLHYNSPESEHVKAMNRCQEVYKEFWVNNENYKEGLTRDIEVIYLEKFLNHPIVSESNMFLEIMERHSE